jgi:hypothetical protein
MGFVPQPILPGLIMTNELDNQFPNLSNLLSCWYHQDVWIEFETDVQVWSAAFEGMGPRQFQALTSEIEALISLGSVASHEYIQANAEALYTDNPFNSVAWLEALLGWLRSTRKCSL